MDAQTPWMNLSNKYLMLSERNQMERLLTKELHLSDILEKAMCKDRKWQGLSGAEVWGGDQWHRGPGGMKRKFHVSYGGGVCDSYMIIHISYSSLNLRRIKLVISKLCIPQT